MSRSRAVVAFVIMGWTAASRAQLPEPLRAMEFVPIPPGTFTMGTTTHWPQDGPPHTVRISRGFELGRYEVTQEQWTALMGDDPSAFAGCELCPVESVAWPDVESFLARLNAVDPRHSYRLPTEAEWEYAAKAGGDGIAKDPMAESWFYTNATDRTHPVGQKSANAWGLHDMHGNVAEWCQDWFAEGYYASSPAVDPQGPETGVGGQLVKKPGIDGRIPTVPKRCVRGGAWYTSRGDLQAAYRGMHRTEPGTGLDTLGLRLVRTAR